jgi:hypothetical protein
MSGARIKSAMFGCPFSISLVEIEIQKPAFSKYNFGRQVSINRTED